VAPSALLPLAYSGIDHLINRLSSHRRRDDLLFVMPPAISGRLGGVSQYVRENVANAVINAPKDFHESRGFRHDDSAHQQNLAQGFIELLALLALSPKAGRENVATSTSVTSPQSVTSCARTMIFMACLHTITIVG
jgi:hypothetical protein